MTVKLRDVVCNMMIVLRSMGPCSPDVLRYEVAMQTIGVAKEDAWYWTVTGLNFLHHHGMVEVYDENMFDSLVPSSSWYEGDLDAMLEELTWPNDEDLA
jgi:hypothetical protein